MDFRDTSEEDLEVIVVEYDITSHKEGDTTLAGLDINIKHTPLQTLAGHYSKRQGEE